MKLSFNLIDGWIIESVVNFVEEEVRELFA